MEFDQTIVKIDLDVLSYNFDLIQKKAGAMVLAVVKADAYGHGAVTVAKTLEGKCDFFGTSSLLEALELRKAGIRTPILVLGRMPVSAFPTAVREDIRPVIFRYEDALELSLAAQAQGKTAPFHFAVDTGLTRIGFQVTEEAADLCVAIAGLPSITAEGLFSHFATADSADETRTRAQAALFAQFDGMLQKRGLKIPIRHLNNSAGIMKFDFPYEMVRAGIILYGMYASDELDPALLPVKPVLRWVSRVAFVKTVPAGREISYGGLYTTERETVLATVPVGYADGYLRSMMGKCQVLIRGKRAPVRGKICMDQIMVDVTDIPGVSIDDEVVIIGTDGNDAVTADELANHAGTINYEITCGIHRRVPRYYIQNGKVVKKLHNLLNLEST